MARVREICYDADVCGKRFGESLVRCVAAELAEVECSGWMSV